MARRNKRKTGSIKADKQRSLAWWRSVCGCLRMKEFCNTTNLHGYKYVTETGLSAVERIFWLSALVIVNTLAALSVFDQTMRYLHTPVLMSIAPVPTPVKSVPFPAVTVCSQNQVRPSYFNYSAFTNTSSPKTVRESDLLDYVNLICSNNVSSDLEYFSYDLMEDIHQGIWKHCRNTIWYFWIKQQVRNACSKVHRTLVADSACYTFNGLSPEVIYRSSYNSSGEVGDFGVGWTPDGGFASDQVGHSPNSTPWRYPNAGFELVPMIFILSLNVRDFDSTCFFGGHGFLVILHSPADIPTKSHPSFYVPADHIVGAHVIPEIRKTDKTLRQWGPDERGCFFQDERPLQYFQLYTQSNCDQECKSNVTLSLCGCVPFFLPRTKETPICGPKKKVCYMKSLLISQSPHIAETKTCNCKPACSEYEYRVEVDVNLKNFSLAKDYSPMGNFIQKRDIAFLLLQYKTQTISAVNRVAMFGFSDFIANVGGLLGLFMGFSFLSLFEIVFFFLLRFCRTKSQKVGVVSKVL